jgi:hypothetical protein
MLKKLLFASVILFITISISFAGSVPNMQEGNWEITTKMEIPGMPMNMPPMKHTQCLTKKDLVPQSSQPGQECKFTQIKVADNTVTWIMQCSGGHGGDMKGNGKITYSGNTLKGKIEMTMPQSNMKMTSHISGHRIGDCK